jgi:hypothetical protein
MTPLVRPRVSVLISADYELFHGRNFYSDDDVLFSPTTAMLATCASLDAPVTLFADVCSVWAHQRFELNSYVDRFEAQLGAAVKAGHDVQLHIHPHWLVAVREGDQWLLPDPKIHLAEFGFAETASGAPTILRRGRDYLQELLRPIKSDYICNSFRAGGLALQPGEHELIRSLLSLGFQIDSSVAKGLTVKLDTIRVDYGPGMVPHEANWYLDPASGIRGGRGSGLFEIPIASFRMGPLDRSRFLVRRLRAIKQRRGSAISRTRRQSRLANLKTLVLANLRYLGKSPYFLLSADTKGFSSDMLLRGFCSYVDAHANDPVIYLSMINHPKLLHTEQIDILRQFIVGLKRVYGNDIRFTSFASVANELSHRAGTGFSEESREP